MARGAVILIISDGWRPGSRAARRADGPAAPDRLPNSVGQPRTQSERYRPRLAAWRRLPYCDAVVQRAQLRGLDDLLADCGRPGAPAVVHSSGCGEAGGAVGGGSGQLTARHPPTGLQRRACDGTNAQPSRCRCRSPRIWAAAGPLALGVASVRCASPSASTAPLTRSGSCPERPGTQPSAAVVRLPARMRAIILEAASGQVRAANAGPARRAWLAPCSRSGRPAAGRVLGEDLTEYASRARGLLVVVASV